MRAAPLELLYLHGPSRIDAEVLAHAGIVHRRLDAVPIVGASPFRLAGNVLRLLRASGQAWREMGAFRPHAVLATGGYVSAPAMLAARLRGVPVVLYLPDAEPGLAVRAFAPLARRIALSFPVTMRYFKPGKAIVTGYPVRPEFLHADRAQGRRTFDLADDLPVVMVMGGSSGAHSLNLAVSDALEPLLHHAQVIHLCGDQDEQLLRQQRGGLDPGPPPALPPLPLPPPGRPRGHGGERPDRLPGRGLGPGRAAPPAPPRRPRPPPLRAPGRQRRLPGRARGRGLPPGRALGARGACWAWCSTCCKTTSGGRRWPKRWGAWPGPRRRTTSPPSSSPWPGASGSPLRPARTVRTMHPSDTTTQPAKTR